MMYAEYCAVCYDAKVFVVVAGCHRSGSVSGRADIRVYLDPQRRTHVLVDRHRFCRFYKTSKDGSLDTRYETTRTYE